MGWDVIIDGELSFASGAKLRGWKAARVAAQPDWPFGGAVRRRGKVSTLLARVLDSEGYAELDEAGARVRVSAVLPEGTFVELGRDIAGGFAAASDHTARGELIFVGHGVELSHRIVIADGEVRTRKLTKKNEGRAAAVLAAAEAEVEAELPDEVREAFAAIPSWQVTEAAWARDVAQARGRLEKTSAKARDPFAPLLAAVLETSMAQKAQHAREAAQAMLREAGGAAAERVLDEIVARAGGKAKPLEALLDALGPRAPERGKATLLSIFREGRAFGPRIAAGRALLRCFSDQGDPGLSNLPDLAARIEPLFAERRAHPFQAKGTSPLGADALLAKLGKAVPSRLHKDGRAVAKLLEQARMLEPDARFAPTALAVLRARDQGSIRDEARKQAALLLLHVAGLGGRDALRMLDEVEPMAARWVMFVVGQLGSAKDLDAVWAWYEASGAPSVWADLVIDTFVRVAARHQKEVVAKLKRRQRAEKANSFPHYCCQQALEDIAAGKAAHRAAGMALL